MDIVDRMFDLVDEKYKEQKEFAEKIKVHPTRVSEWRKRKSHSYVKRLELISEALNTTPGYLLTGEGPKHKTKAVSNSDTVSDDDIKAAFFNGADPTLTPEERDAMWEDAQEYFRFKIAQRRQKQKNGE